MDAIWGESPPRTAVHVLHVYVSDLPVRWCRWTKRLALWRGPVLDDLAGAGFLVGNSKQDLIVPVDLDVTSP